HFHLREKAVEAARNQDRHEETGPQEIPGHAQRRDDVRNKARPDQDQHQQIFGRIGRARTRAERTTDFRQCAPGGNHHGNRGHEIQNMTGPRRFRVIPKDRVGAEKLWHLMKKNVAPRRQTESLPKSASLGLFDKQEMPVSQLMSEAPPNRRRVAAAKKEMTGSERSRRTSA